MIKKVLTIAGSDCSGGAGIQADLKTFAVHKTYGMSVITALTAQNTTGVSSVFDVPCEFVAEQIDAIFEDIIPDAVKIGMVSNIDIIHTIIAKLKQYNAKNIVVDPVMVATSGARLISKQAETVLKENLLGIATVITPNIPETEVICGFKVENEDDMMRACQYISTKYNCATLVKGGHLVSDAVDYLFLDGKGYWYKSPRIDNDNTHGTGCTLSSAIACNLANGYNLDDSIKNAKQYLTNALKANLNIGKGRGPLNHTF